MVGLVGVLGLLAFAGGATAKRQGTTLNLVAYSTPKPVLGQIVAAFQKTAAGEGISVTQSYGPSGSQARAIVAGQPTDVAFLSTGLDIDSLVSAELVSKTWPRAAYGGIAADSVVAFVVRAGNPKHIHNWSDLVKPGVQVVTPNPFSSGSAKWNILAAYGAMRKTGKTDKQATAFVRELFQHVVAQDSSGANATNTFLSGKGDVLITYESEAYAALAAGKDIHMVIPKQTMLIELPMVPTLSAPPEARQFIAYVQSAPAQTILAENGYRPVDKSVLKKPALKKWRLAYTGGSRLVFPIADKLFGGWAKANKTWFDPTSGRMVAIERTVGGPTG
ncbi:MAG TPA: sulfate ABC transporter substrate-binding protein [Gaiellaceae bacterium]|nr:sulfate ABC transporter substrate-binding protein [Gaiellaceae bacterium]